MEGTTEGKRDDGKGTEGWREMKGREGEQGELVLEGGLSVRIWQRLDIRRYHVSWGVGTEGQ